MASTSLARALRARIPGWAQVAGQFDVILAAGRKQLFVHVSERYDKTATIGTLIAILRGDPDITQLTLTMVQACDFPDAALGAAVIEAAFDHPSLTEVMFHNVTFSDGTAAALARSLEAAPTLFTLKFYSCTASEHAYASFWHGMSYNRSVQSLTIMNDDMTPASIAFAARAVSLNHGLKYLRVYTRTRAINAVRAAGDWAGTIEALLPEFARSGTLRFAVFGRDYKHSVPRGTPFRYSTPRVRFLARTRVLVQAGRARPSSPRTKRRHDTTDETLAWLMERAPLWVAAKVVALLWEVSPVSPDTIDVDA